MGFKALASDTYALSCSGRRGKKAADMCTDLKSNVLLKAGSGVNSALRALQALASRSLDRDVHHSA